MASRSGETLHDERRRPLTLQKLLKSGGAGSVYTLKERPTQVAKLYHSQKDAPLYERKLRAMLELQPDLPPVQGQDGEQVQIAWPIDLLRDRRGRFVGFSMPILDVSATTDLEHVLQERQARAEGLPTGLGAKMTLAANLAAMMAELHRRQHYVVDLKPLNVRFYRRSLFIAMLDCDGFSIQGKGERFPAGQVTPDYLAAEFHKHGVKAGQEEAQDRFALAVVLFQLLNSGLHPYSGRPQGATLPNDLPGRIAAHLYPYALNRPDARMLPSPVSGHEAFPVALRELFDRAFSDSPRRRPSAQEWATLLMGYARRSEGALVACRKDGAHQHFAGLPCAACARSSLLAASKRAASPRGKGAPGKGKKKRQPRVGRVARNMAQARLATVQGQAAAANAANAAHAAAAALSPPVGPPGPGWRAVIAITATLVLGWVMGWGMPTFRNYSAKLAPGFLDALAMGWHLGLLAVAVLVFVLCAPVFILSRRT